MHARALGVDFSLQDGLAVDGVGAGGRPGGDPTVARVDRDRVVAALAAAPSHRAPDRLRIAAVPGHGWVVAARGAGAALVSDDGRALACAPEPGSPSWPALLSAQIVPLVATLRGLEVFHAAGIVHDGRAHLLCGGRGVGKTSLATRLALAGAGVLADDVVAVDESLVAHPGPTVLHVRASERARLERDGGAAGLAWASRRAGRDRLMLGGASASAPACTLGGIHLLGRYVAGEAIRPVPDPPPRLLLGATFNLAVRTPQRLTRQLSLCARLAREVPVTQVRIVPGRDAGELAARLLAHLDDPAPARV